MPAVVMPSLEDSINTQPSLLIQYKGNAALDTESSMPSPSLASSTLSAQAVQQIAAVIRRKQTLTPAQQKIHSQLLDASEVHRGVPAPAGVPRMHPGAIDIDSGGGTVVDIQANVSDALLAQLANLGGSIISIDPGKIRLRLPVDNIERFAGLTDVISIWPETKGGTYSTLSTEGDVTHRANLARFTWSPTSGAGLTVGILSDSVDDLSSLQAFGILPGNCTPNSQSVCGGPQASCVCVLPGILGYPTGGNGQKFSSEGTAMMEIIHTLAPGAKLAFAAANDSEAEFQANILNLKAAGAQIILDDVWYGDESPFQDGATAQNIDTVVGQGVTYLSAVGNGGSLASGTSSTWEGNYSGTNVPGLLAGLGTSALNFGAGSVANTIVGSAAQGTNATVGWIQLWWSDPLNGSGNDYDLYLIENYGNLVYWSNMPQTGSQNPYEGIRWQGGDIHNYQLVVLAYGGAQPRYMHLEVLPTGQLQYQTTGNATGHNAAAQAISVGALDVHSTCHNCNPFVPHPFTGGAANPVETFSSDGPRAIFFHRDGTPISQQQSNFQAVGGQYGLTFTKPDILAADEVSTNTVPPQGPPNYWSAYMFNPFYGTSAAVPHAGAIAALLMSRNPTLLQPSQQGVMRTLLTSATLPVTPQGNNSGTGILDAWNAVDGSSPFFNGQGPTGSGWYYLPFPSGNSPYYFGNYTYEFWPWMWHSDMGFEYVQDANDSSNGVYMYDPTLEDWFYTNPADFPFLYNFGSVQAPVDHWWWYEPTSNRHYTTNPRWFSDLFTGQWIPSGASQSQGNGSPGSPP